MSVMSNQHHKELIDKLQHVAECVIDSNADSRDHLAQIAMLVGKIDDRLANLQYDRDYSRDLDPGDWKELRRIVRSAYSGYDPDGYHGKRVKQLLIKVTKVVEAHDATGLLL